MLVVSKYVEIPIFSGAQPSSKQRFFAAPGPVWSLGFTRTPQQCFSGGRGSLKLPRQEWMPEELLRHVGSLGKRDTCMDLLVVNMW
jgi:hypothetical protein